LVNISLWLIYPGERDPVLTV